MTERVPGHRFLREKCVALAVALTLASACSLGTAPLSRSVPPPLTARGESGIASWYGPGFHGNATSSGEIYDQHDMTAAHRTLPLGTRVAVTNLDNGRSVEVRVNDRGPFVDGRIIDLSFAAASAIDMIGPGTARVSVDPAEGLAALPSPVRYALQAGAFVDGRKADALREALARERRDVYVTPHRARDAVYYRVRIGPYGLREEAAATAHELAASGVRTMIVEEVGP